MNLLIILSVFAIPFTISYLIIQRNNRKKDRSAGFNEDDLIFPDHEEHRGTRWDIIISSIIGVVVLALYIVAKTAHLFKF